MSGAVLFEAMDCDGLKPAMKLLLVALADRADEAGVCWPSRNDLTLRMGLSFSTITRTARALEASGWIARKQRKDASTLYRLNLLKISRCAAQCRADRKLRKAQGDWPAFPEEIEAQAVENNGEGQIDPTSGHTEPGSGHGDTLTSQEPLKNLKPASRSLKKGKARASGRCASRPVDSASLSPFQRSRVLSGQSVVVAGSLVEPGTAYALALCQALRGQSALEGARHGCA